MKFGITMFPTDYAIGPGELAREVEAHGFESLFFPEHTHIPASRRSRPGRAVPTCRRSTRTRSTCSWR